MLKIHFLFLTQRIKTQKNERQGIEDRKTFDISLREVSLCVDFAAIIRFKANTCIKLLLIFSLKV